jgi:hypothetical protein
VSWFLLYPQTGSLDIPHRQQDALSLEQPAIRYSDSGKHSNLFDETKWTECKLSVQDKDSWSVHEEERVAFEIKTDLIRAKGGGMA